VLDDDDGGLVELLRQLPAGVQIDEVVEAEFLALQLASAGDAQAGAVGIERGALVGVFAVAQDCASGKLMRRVVGRLVASRTADAEGAGASAIWSSVLAMAVS
jgi:hypothetical protein